MLLRVLAFGLAILSVARVSAAEPLQPTKKWVVDFAESQCAAMRSYSADQNNPLTLAFKPSSTGRMMQIFIGEPGGKQAPLQHDVTVTIHGAKPTVVRTTLLRYADPEKKLNLASVILPHEKAEALRNSTGLSIAGIGYRQAFSFGQMHGVMAALDECVSSLRQWWHIGEAKSAVKVPAKPHKPLDLYLRDDDYPGIARNKAFEGELVLTLLVDEQGGVKNCTVEETSGVAVLDAMGCGVLANRARYHPALDESGKPLKSHDFARIRFKWDWPPAD